MTTIYSIVIKAFRKIRWRLASDNKMLKYLKYAVGEIFLIVIGILIALHLNNQNQQRQTEERIDLLLNEVLVELDDFINQSARVLNFYRNKQQLYELILTDKLSYDDYANRTYPALTTATTWYSISRKKRIGYENLTQEINTIPARYKPIMHQLQSLYGGRFNDRYGEMVEDISNQNIRKRVDNYEWYALPVADHNNEDMIEFMLHDYRYKSEVKHYAVITGYYTRYIMGELVMADSIRTAIVDLLDLPRQERMVGAAFDRQTKEILHGQWAAEALPGAVYTIFEEGDRLKYRSNTAPETPYLFSLGNRQFLDTSNGLIFDIEKEGNEYVYKYVNGLTFRRVGHQSD